MTTSRRLAVLLFIFLAWTPAAYAWSWPVQGPVLKPFVYDEAHPYAAGQHRGIDIGADAAGETVVAPAAGTVSFAGSVPTNGKTVTIETADGYSVTLTHLGSIAVAQGAAVAEQATVGTVGPSGTPEVDGPYVHLGIRLTADPNGYVDPLGLLPQPPGDSATQTSTTASQPASSGTSSAAPRSKPARSVPRSTRAATTRPPRSEPVRPRLRIHQHEHVQKPHAEAQTTSSQQRPVVRDRPSEQTSYLQRPVVEQVALKPTGRDARHEPRPTTYLPPPRSRPSRPLPALVCNWAAALFALGAVLLARRRRSSAACAQVVRLPLPGDELRRVSRAA